MAKDTRSTDRLTELESEILRLRREFDDIKGDVTHLAALMTELTSRLLPTTTNVDELSRLVKSNSMELTKLLLKSISTVSEIPNGNGVTENGLGTQISMDSVTTNAVNRNRGLGAYPQFSSLAAMPRAFYPLPIEFPKFDGSDFTRWASKCRQLFEVDETPMERRIKIISIHLEGKALQWHRCFMKGKKSGEVKWEEYMEEMAKRFLDLPKLHSMSELKMLKQEDSVMEYLEKFEEIISEVDLPEDVIISIFLVGLKPEIEFRVRMFGPSNLANAMYLARLQEDYLLATQSFNAAEEH